MDLSQESVAAAHSYRIEDFLDGDFAENYWHSFGLELAFSGDAPSFGEKKDSKPNKYESVDQHNTTPLLPQVVDLAVLHWIAVSRQVVTAVEFGSGFSTAILALAMYQNQVLFGDWVLAHRRIAKPFVVNSVDESRDWLDTTSARISSNLLPHVSPVASKVSMTSFNGRYSSRYSDFNDPVCDFVIIDGPSQYAPGADEALGLFTTAKPHLMPMASDVLPVEHFFEPGAIIFVDGRTSNARFLKQNLQRGWRYHHFLSADFHIFELQEEPLGPVNRARLENIPGSKWLLEGD